MATTTPITIVLGGGWRMTVTRAEMVGPKLQAWCGFAKTEKDRVEIYGDLDDDTERAQVIFEPQFTQDSDGWSAEYDGRTFLDSCPESGRDKPAEQDLLAMIPLDDVLRNICMVGLLMVTA